MQIVCRSELKILNEKERDGAVILCSFLSILLLILEKILFSLFHVHSGSVLASNDIFIFALCSFALFSRPETRGVRYMAAIQQRNLFLFFSALRELADLNNVICILVRRTKKSLRLFPSLSFLGTGQLTLLESTSFYQPTLQGTRKRNGAIKGPLTSRNVTVQSIQLIENGKNSRREIIHVWRIFLCKPSTWSRLSALYAQTE